MSAQQRFSEERLQEAQKHSIYNRAEIEASDTFGCYHCRRPGTVNAIIDWADDDTTALCPRCGIDAVIGDASGFPATNLKFLGEMKRRWF